MKIHRHFIVGTCFEQLFAKFHTCKQNTSEIGFEFWIVFFVFGFEAVTKAAEFTVHVKLKFYFHECGRDGVVISSC